MANIDIFKNTYITKSGRGNYFRIKDEYIEDPLFTSFTFDIDYITSPLFYTINNTSYKTSSEIETALEGMHAAMSEKDQGYDILPVYSAEFLNNEKLGFGLQKNVYMDKPLYGATEYIYMVDKRNGSNEQNDVRYETVNGSSYSSYKLGDSVKEVVNESDKKWAESQKEKNESTIEQCDDILSDEDIINEHEKNKNEFESIESEYKTIIGEGDKEKVLQDKIDELNKLENEFEKLKKDIINWSNKMLSNYQSKGTSIYTENKCVQEIFLNDCISIEGSEYIETYTKELERKFPDFKSKYLFTSNNSYVAKFDELYKEIMEGDGSFLYKNDNTLTIRDSKLLEKFREKLESFGLCEKGGNIINGDVIVSLTKSIPDWAKKLKSHLCRFTSNSEDYNDDDENIRNIMSFECDINMAFGEDFTSDKIEKNREELVKLETELDNLRITLYGMKDGEICDKSNPSEDSVYGRYLDAKDKFENDEYSQAEKSKQIAESGVSEMESMLNEYNNSNDDGNSGNSVAMQPQENDGVTQSTTNTDSPLPNTVLDIIGFIGGMKKMTTDYPYIIQGITGLDTAYNKHYVVKDPYSGSGDDKITISCLESLDLRVSSMFNRYFNAVYDRQYRRERVPVNLRRFNCSVYVHDVRNFVAKMRGEFVNRIIELTDMYHSVVEFRFYDCEIVPEETGNIFDNISNEAPSEMKKTNFTFTYGNCVVNFVPKYKVVNV